MATTYAHSTRRLMALVSQRATISSSAAIGTDTSVSISGLTFHVASARVVVSPKSALKDGGSTNCMRSGSCSADSALRSIAIAGSLAARAVAMSSGPQAAAIAAAMISVRPNDGASIARLAERRHDEQRGDDGDLHELKRAVQQRQQREQGNERGPPCRPPHIEGAADREIASGVRPRKTLARWPCRPTRCAGAVSSTMPAKIAAGREQPMSLASRYIA